MTGSSTGDLRSGDVVSDAALLTALLHDSPVRTLVLDHDLRVQRCTGSAEAVDRLADLFLPSLAHWIGAHARQVLATGHRVDETTPSTTGVDRLAASFRPLRSATGGVTHVAVYLTEPAPADDADGGLAGPAADQANRLRLQQAIAALAGAVTVADVGQVAAELGRAALGAHRVTVALIEEDGLVFQPSPEAPEPAARPLSMARPTPSAVAARTGRPVYVAHAGELAGLAGATTGQAGRLGPAELDDESGERAWAVLPLGTTNGRLGVLRIAFDHARPFGPEERELLEVLAGQCALALARALLYERERRNAAALQRSLLPERLPVVAGLDLAAVCLPGSADAEVGGDWYDAFLIPDGRLAVVVGDVMGKGLAAAIVMGRVRSALRALTFADPRPCAVLTGLDRLFAATEDDDQIVTLVYVLVDPLTGGMLSSGAGHPPLLIVPATGPPYFFDPGREATPLGVPEPRADRALHLAPGDTLVAFSDGLVETREESVDTGLLGLMAAVQAMPLTGSGSDAQGMVDHLVRVLPPVSTRMSGRADDVTCLAIQVTGT